MAESPTATSRTGEIASGAPDDVTIRHWFAFYGVFLLVTVVPLAVLISREPWGWNDWISDPAGTFAGLHASIKLVTFLVYISLCCTFLPLPTGGVVAGVATREAAVAAGASDNVVVIALLTTLIVGLVGAAGSTIANLNDYHLFTWMLRNHKVGQVRRTKVYRAAARWFARSPLFLLVVFNVIPIPVDVVRMVATTYRYPRLPFAGANFIGRFIRYGVIAFVTYWFNLGWLAVAALLALAVVLGGVRVTNSLARRIRERRTNLAAVAVSNTQETEEK